MSTLYGCTNGTFNDSQNCYDQSSSHLPILIAGGGCVGLFAALLLSQSHAPNPIIVIEPIAPDLESTRAMAHQPLTYPILSRVQGLLPELMNAGTLATGLCFRSSVANGSKVIVAKTFGQGGDGKGTKGKGQLLLPQGKFQQVLMTKIAEAGSKAEVRLGQRIIGLESSADSITVKIAIINEKGEEELEKKATYDVEASYLIAADGAHSLIRKTLGLDFSGETLDAQLVATDIHFDFHTHGFYDANFILDPIDYGLIGLITRPEESTASTPMNLSSLPLWRVSYAVPPTYTQDDINSTVDEKLRRMLPNSGHDGHGSKAYKIVRIAPYKPQQRLASTLYTSRVCLIGDAAHLTNPYAGLGLASGIADASSLVDVLVHVLTEIVEDPDVLLQNWSTARRKKFDEVIDRPSRMAYARVKSDVSSEEKIMELMSRDELVRALKEGMPVLPPSLETRGEELDGW